MNHYEECLNAMWKWKRIVEKYSHYDGIVQTEFGILDMAGDAMKDVLHGENLSYEEYLQALFNSRNDIRNCFEHCYYSYADCYFKGQISRFDNKKDKVVFDRIFVSAMYMDGTGYFGKEDHVWMDAGPFEQYQVGDCLAFGGEIYRYLKTGNGKQISFGLKEPYDIKKMEAYDLPSDDDLMMQAVDEMICEVCLFNEHCYMGMCLANQEWREEMRRLLLDAVKNG